MTEEEYRYNLYMHYRYPLWRKPKPPPYLPKDMIRALKEHYKEKALCVEFFPG